MYVTYHALRRCREHYPAIDFEGIRGIAASAVEVDPEIARLCMGRRPPPANAGKKGDTDTHYLWLDTATKDVSGLFVVETDRGQPIRLGQDGHGVMITYIRLGLTQSATMRRLCSAPV